MNTVESLYSDIESKDISVVESHFSPTKKAACLQFEDIRAIVLNSQLIESSAEELTILAEELGHLETGSLYSACQGSNSYIYNANRIKCERRAKRYAIELLLPFDGLHEALRQGCREIFELAEHFGVTEELVREAIDYHRCQGLCLHLGED